MSLPRSMVMKSNASGKYLRYTKGNSSTLSSLTFSHEMKRPNLDVAESLGSLKKDDSPMELHLLKFEVHDAKDAPGFVHIRTSYNNKYLVRKSEDNKSIVAEAHEAEEDQSKWSCTLFKPIFLGEVEDDGNEEEGGSPFSNKHGIGMLPQKIQLMHAMSQDYVYMDTETGSMELISTATAPPTMLTVLDVEPTAVLPYHLAVRGDDGNYVGTPNGADLWFRYNDLGNAAVPMARLYISSTVPSPIVLSPQNYNGYWIVNRNNDVGVSVNGATAFSPIKVGNHVALYVGNTGRFASRTSANGLTARSTTIIDGARLEVVEPVLSRKILNMTYDLKNARVYDTTDVTKITDSRSNYTNQRETGSLSRDFTMSRTMSWNQSLTVSAGMSMSMSFGVPSVGIGGEISINFSISYTSEWGEQKTQTETITHTYDFDVPPMTMQTKTVVATRSSCDVPFTCEVEDLMTNGTINRYTKTDCLFRGGNDYNAKQETRNYPLRAQSLQ